MTTTPGPREFPPCPKCRYPDPYVRYQEGRGFTPPQDTCFQHPDAPHFDIECARCHYRWWEADHDHE